MRGYDGKTTKTATTVEFSLEFGTKGEFSSQLDNAAKLLYNTLSEMDKSKVGNQVLLDGVSKYFKDCILLDDIIVWEYIKRKLIKKISKELLSESELSDLEDLEEEIMEKEEEESKEE